MGERGLTPSQSYRTYVFNSPTDFEEHISDLKKPPAADWSKVGGYWLSPTFTAARSKLLAAIEEHKPAFILLQGNAALFALTLAYGVRKWRGSTFVVGSHRAIAIATWEPETLVRDWSLRPQFSVDAGRLFSQVVSGPVYPVPYRVCIRPRFARVARILRAIRARADAGPIHLSGDYETRAGHIACFGIAWSDRSAVSIPFMCLERDHGYWYEHEEQQIILWLHELATHSNIKWSFQNGNYDQQYAARWWHFVFRIVIDTMIAHHAMFPADQKSLGYLSSIYCQTHVYWKDDGKVWEAKMDEDQLWRYNGIDCCRTWEIAEAEVKTITRMGFWPQFHERHDLPWMILLATTRGVRVNHKLKADLILELHEAVRVREEWLETVLGEKVNIKSPPQMARLFYEDFGIKPIKNRKTGRVTTDDEALKKIGKSDPILGRITGVISELRSLGVFTSTFLEAKTDWDGRMRSSFNPCGTETLRLSSSQNAFDGGLNFQNIPNGDEENSSGYPFPNVRKLFLPDEGYEIADMDLDRADLQVVVWEADDPELKQALRDGVDLHIFNGLTIFGKPIPPLDELIEGHPNYPEHKKRYGKERQFAKAFIHGTNYGGGPRTMAITAGITVRESEAFQTRWFSARPGIKRWHERTERQLQTRRYVENRFGYRRYYFDRPDGILPEALAWVPQSTVALVINRAWRNIVQQLRQVEVLIQVHDSLVMQYPIAGNLETREAIKRVSRIEVPYDDPLVIPVGLNCSHVSWGHCK